MLLLTLQRLGTPCIREREVGEIEIQIIQLQYIIHYDVVHGLEWSSYVL